MKRILFTFLAISFSFLAVAQNDCGSAIAIGPGAHTAAGPTMGNGATNTCNTGGATHANWFAYTAVATGTATVAASTGGDTRVVIHTGACGALVCYANDDDGGAGLLSAATFNVCAGVTYYIEWDDRWNDDPINFDVSETPGCSDPSDASIAATSDGFDATTTWTSGAGICGGGYEWEVVADGDAAFAGNDINSGTGSYPISLPAVTGLMSSTDYDLYVRDVCGASFSNNIVTNFTTTAAGYPGSCGTALVITAGAHTAPGPNAGGGASNSCAGTGANNANWYAYTSAVTGTATVASSSGGDTRVSIFTGACGALTCYESDDDGGAGLLSSATFNVCMGTTYYIEWDDRWNDDPIDFDVTETAGCINPGTATIAVTTDGFDGTTTWTAGGGACGGGYEWEIVADGDAAFAGNDVDGGTGAYPVALAAVTGLSAGTAYDLYVRDVCGASFSGNILTDFTTTPLAYPGTCADADVIAAGSHTAPGPASGGGATNSCAGTAATNANWYAYTAAVTGTATVEATAGGDTRVSIYTGTCASLTCYESDDDGGTGLLSLATFNVCMGTTYYIEWDDRWNDDPIDFDLTETAVCSDPGTATVTATTDGFDGTTTWTAGGGACGGGYEWEVVADGDAAFAGNDIDGGSGAYPVVLAALTGLTDGTNYDLYVRDVCGASFSTAVLNNFTTLPLVLPNTCADAVVVTAGSHTAVGPSTGGTATNVCNTGGATNASWYSYTPAVTGTASVEATSGGDTRLVIHSGACGALVCVANDDDGGTGLLSSATFNICAGTTYYIEWDDRWNDDPIDFDITETAACSDPGTATITATTDGFDATTTWTEGAGTCGGGYEWEIVADGDAAFAGNDIQSGTGSYPVVLAAATGLSAGTNYDLYVRDVCGASFSTNVLTNFTTVPLVLPNTCADALVIIAGSYTAVGPSTGAGASNSCAGTAATNATWYSYTPAVTGTATVEATSGGDTRLSVHTGACGALVCYSDDDDGGIGLLSATTFNICAGTTYYIEWDDRWNDDPIDFDVTETATCGDPGIAAGSPSLDGLDAGTTWTEGGGICGGGYEWEIVADGDAAFAGNDITSGSGTYPASLAAVTGLMPATDYDLYVRDVCGASFSTNVLTNFTTLTPPPANDDCADAIVVFSGYTVTGFSTVGATGTDITSCVFNDANSVWFEYTAPCNTTIEVNTNGSNYDTGLAIFDACGGSELACDDDGGTGTQSLVSFLVTGGSTYFIRVAGFNGATGDINFSIIETGVACPCLNNVWTGATNSDWSEATNWTCGVVPTNGCNGTTDNAIVPAGASVTPVVAGTLGVGDLEISSGSSIIVNGVLEVCGNVNHVGTPLTGTGNVELIGAVAQTITGTGTFENLELDNAAGANVMAAADVSISNSLVLTAGNLTNAGSVTLLSDAAGTAYLDDFTTPGNTYVGDITVERYVTAGFGLGQRYFGSAVGSGSVSGLYGGYTSYPLGQLIPFGCNPNYVATASPYSNLFEWHEDATFATSCIQEGWFAISAGTALTTGRGYSGWMNDASTLSVTGQPNTAPNALDITYGPLTNTASGVAGAEGWHLLSNPFPSPMNIDAVYNDGFTSPQYYNAASGAFSGTFQPAIMSGAEVPVMQGFVANTVGGGTFAPTNADRIASNNSNFFRPLDYWFDYKLEVEVAVNGNSDITYLYYSDQNTIDFDNESDCIKRHSDANKPTLYTKSDKNSTDEMSLNGLHLDDLGMSIPLGLIAGEDGNYTFTFTGTETFPSNTSIYVEDNSTGIIHTVQENGTYTFDALVADNGAERFVIHFSLPAAFNVIEPTCENTNGTIVELTMDNRAFEMNLDGAIIETGILDGSSIDLSHGDYSIEVFDQYGGSQMYAISISEVVNVNTEIINSANIIETDGLVNFDYSGQGASSFEWFVNGQSVAQTQMFEYEFTQAGDYVVTLVASNSTCSDSKEVTITVNEKTTTTTIVDLGDNASLVIYSENGNVMVEFTNVKEANAEVSVYNLIGQNMINKVVETNGTQVVPNQNWASSYYLVKVRINDEVFNATVLLNK